MSARQREEQHKQGIFLCYRREDSRWQAGRLADALASRFGDTAVFMDVDRLRIGNWRKQIDQSLADCAAVIVVIGPQWLPLLEQRSTTDDQASDDQVRYEIAQALRLDKIWLGTFWAHSVSTEVNSGESHKMSFHSSRPVRLRDQHPRNGFDSRQLHREGP